MIFVRLLPMLHFVNHQLRQVQLHLTKIKRKLIHVLLLSANLIPPIPLVNHQQLLEQLQHQVKQDLLRPAGQTTPTTPTTPTGQTGGTTSTGGPQTFPKGSDGKCPTGTAETSVGVCVGPGTTQSTTTLPEG